MKQSRTFWNCHGWWYWVLQGGVITSSGRGHFNLLIAPLSTEEVLVLSQPEAWQQSPTISGKCVHFRTFCSNWKRLAIQMVFNYFFKFITPVSRILVLHHRQQINCKLSRLYFCTIVAFIYILILIQLHVAHRNLGLYGATGSSKSRHFDANYPLWAQGLGRLSLSLLFDKWKGFPYSIHPIIIKYRLA